MSLAIDYCKEIARELQQTAIYLPGSSVKPGDILRFRHTDIFGKPKPLGEFAIEGNLSNLGIDLPVITEEPGSADSYVYASKGEVSVSFESEGQSGDFLKGTLNIGFSKEGATYLSALDCVEHRFAQILELEKALSPHRGKYDWKSFYIVTSVIVADKALVMQSNSKSASLEIKGSVKDLVPGGSVLKDISAKLGLNVTRYKEASFIMDWSNNVPVFMSLVRYRKRFLGSWDVSGKKMMTISGNLSMEESPEYIIEAVDPLQEI